MLKIHFVSAVRTLLKSRGIALINVIGLTLGLTAYLFIVHYLLYETSFDSFFPDSGSIYRINMDIQNGSERFYHSSKTSRGLYFCCQKDVPGIEACGDSYFESCLMRYNSNYIPQQRVLWVDEGFEKVFPFILKEGSVDFTGPLKGIIARSKVSGLFGNEDPVGKIIKVNEGMPVEITGVFDDLPSNTHFTADYFISLKTWEKYGWISRERDWNYNGYWNYIKLEKGVSPESVEATLTSLVNNNVRRNVNDRKATIFLQPLSDLHYQRGLEGEMGSQTSQKSLFFLLVIAILTIFIAWINYVNLSTALSSKRADEIGMRKLAGASGLHIWIQSFIETLILNLIAIILSVTLYLSLLQPFAGLFQIPLSQAIFPGKYIIWSFIGISCIGLFFSSIYNTFKLTGVNPFSGKKSITGRRSFQKSMVIAQMALSIIFISVTLVVYKQILFMRNNNMGINFDQVVTISAPASLNIDSTKRSRYLSFRQELLRSPEFISATANTFTPGLPPRYGFNEYVRHDAGIHPNKLFFENNADDGLVETFGLKLIAGENFSPIPSENRRRVLINESSLKEFDFKKPEEAIGRFIFRAGRDSVPIEIIGVLADFHNEGLQKPIYPMIYNNGHPFEFGYYSIRIKSPDISRAIDDLKRIWDNHYPSDQMEYVFADELFFRQYQSEARFGKFYLLLTILSISIACLGLYGLIIFYLNLKQKEIGLRKINGAKVTEVMIMLNLNFIKWIAFAFILACPFAWFAMNKWLQSFAYRTELSWWVFVIAGIIALIIALVTVSWQSWKSATRNPAEALRYE